MAKADTAYRQLFSHSQVVADLVKGFLQGTLARSMDLSTLTQEHTLLVSLGLRALESDVLWQVRLQDGSAAYLLIEFQSSVDNRMAERVLSYIAALYRRRWQREPSPSGTKLPLVVPIVVYHGRRRWTAARQVADLVVAVPRGNRWMVPQMRYGLVDVWRQDRRKLAKMRNVVAAVFRLELAQTLEEAVAVLRDINRWWPAPQFDSLRAAVLDWVKEYWYPHRFGGKIVPQVADLWEMERYMQNKPKTILQLAKERAKEAGRRQGRRLGLEEGRQVGLEEGRRVGLEAGLEQGRRLGEAEMLLRQLERKFGVVPADIRRRVQSATSERLLEWAERVLLANRLDEVFS